ERATTKGGSKEGKRRRERLPSLAGRHPGPEQRGQPGALMPPPLGRQIHQQREVLAHLEAHHPAIGVAQFGEPETLEKEGWRHSRVPLCYRPRRQPSTLARWDDFKGYNVCNVGPAPALPELRWRAQRLRESRAAGR